MDRQTGYRTNSLITVPLVGAVGDTSDTTASGPSRIGAYQRRGAVSTFAMAAARVPFNAMFNVTGQPAAVVPWGSDREGLPVAIQLVGRPYDEATLLALAAQIERARPWAHRRPSVS